MDRGPHKYLGASALLGDTRPASRAARRWFNLEIGPQLEAVIATSAELQDRALLKKVGMAAAMAHALRERGVEDAVAAMAGEVGVLAFRDGYDAWTADGNTRDLNELVSEALQRVRSAAGKLG
ncbi:hypothetical protein [Microbacterium allomyrinae]|uniref:Uncharacterized protein n=1 Tax=Microbacterium allomyrinae TaxID=2830666 RepID=A0A9X1LW97_9MICO|nr:hypothetical protein [Microbacterium allomyrinae]MCC2033274.1 hypothetical protein [Microbacterium allomyrinae]